MDSKEKRREKEMKKPLNKTTHKIDTLSESRIEQDPDIELEPRDEHL